MTSNMIVTLEEKEKYFLVYETIYNNIKYFMANKLDEKDEPTGESIILEEIKCEDGIYLDSISNEKTLNFLSTYFTAGFIKEVEEI